MAQKVNFSIYQIDDVEGYGWELNYTDPTGEVTSVEEKTWADVVDHINDVCQEWGLTDWEGAPRSE